MDQEIFKDSDDACVSKCNRFNYSDIGLLYNCVQQCNENKRAFDRYAFHCFKTVQDNFNYCVEQCRIVESPQSMETEKDGKYTSYGSCIETCTLDNIINIRGLINHLNNEFENVK